MAEPYSGAVLMIRGWQCDVCGEFYGVAEDEPTCPNPSCHSESGT